MTKSEALVFLGANEGDDLSEALGDLLFEFRQFFTSKPVIGKTFRSRLDKLQHLEVAAETLAIELPVGTDIRIKEFNPNGAILHDFMNYQDLKSDWMLRMHKVESPAEMRQLIHLMLDVEFKYTGLWQDNEVSSNEIILSREPDPMGLLTDIKLASDANIATFSELAGDLTDRFELLKKESKRMFLLHKKEIEWKTFLKN